MRFTTKKVVFSLSVYFDDTLTNGFQIKRDFMLNLNFVLKRNIKKKNRILLL